MTDAVSNTTMAEKLDKIIDLLGKLASAERPRPRRLLRLKEAASYISVSPWKLRGMIQGGEIPVVRNGDGAGGVWLLDTKDLDEWINRTKVRL
jgi:excisionase family DNA binding protein